MQVHICYNYYVTLLCMDEHEFKPKTCTTARVCPWPVENIIEAGYCL